MRIKTLVLEVKVAHETKIAARGYLPLQWDVRKIWGGFSTQIINMGVEFWQTL